MINLGPRSAVVIFTFIFGIFSLLPFQFVEAGIISEEERERIVIKIAELREKLDQLLTLQGLRTAQAVRICNEVELSWQAVEGAQRYIILRNGQEIHRAGRSSTSFKDSDIRPGGYYVYEVVSENVAGRGPSALSRTVVVDRNCPSPPSVLFAETGSCGGQVDISWNNGTQAEYFELYPGNTLVFRGSGNSFIDRSLRVGQSYSYKIRSVNSLGRSAFSESVSARSSAVCPPDRVVEFEIRNEFALREAEVDLLLSSQPRRDASIREGRSAEVMRFEISSKGADALVSRIDLTFDKDPSRYIDLLTIRDVSGRRDLGSVSVDRSSVSVIERGNAYRVRFSEVSLNVPKDSTRSVSVLVKAESTLPLNEVVDFNVYLERGAIRASDEAGIQHLFPRAGFGPDSDLFRNFTIGQ